MRRYTKAGWASIGSMVFLAVLALCTAWTETAWGEESGAKLSGEVQHELAISLNGDGVVANTASYRLSLSGELGGAGWAVPGSVYISVKGEHDLQSESGKLADLDEAYVDLYFSGADLRLGQQVVSWGTAYGLNPTSYVNPMPSPASSGGAGPAGGVALELARLPVPAVSASLYPSWGDVGLVAVLNPRLQGVPLPEDVQAEILRGIAYQVAQEKRLPQEAVTPSADHFSAEPPESLSDRLEYAARVGTRMGNWDLYLSGFRGWEDYPVLWVSFSPVMDPTTGLGPIGLSVNPNARYRKVTEAGLAASCTWGPYTLWGEGSYAWPDRMPELDDTNNIAFSSNEPHWQAVLGGDRTIGDAGDVYLMAEYICNSNGSLVTPYRFAPGESGARRYLVGTARWQPAQDHQLEVSGVYCMSDGSYVAMPRYTYQLSQSTSLWLGLALPGGDEGTDFGGLSDARSATLGVKLAF
ncbi:MAG: DUF1302 family protein [Bacillota bacterium]